MSKPSCPQQPPLPSPPQCDHLGQMLIVCIYPGCQQPDLSACRKCILSCHQHGLFVPHSTVIKQRLSPIMNIISRRYVLEQTIKSHFQSKRKAMLESINRQQSELLTKLQGIITRDYARSLTEVHAGNLTDRKLVGRILNRREVLEGGDVQERLERVEQEVGEIVPGFRPKGRVRSEEGHQQQQQTLKKQHVSEKVVLHSSPTALTQKEAELLERLQRMDESQEEEELMVRRRNGEEQKENQLRVESQPQSVSSHDIPEQAFIQNPPTHIPPSLPPPPTQQIPPTTTTTKLLEFSSFAQASSTNPSTLFEPSIEVIINFKKPSPTPTPFNQHRANIADFCNWLKLFTNTKKLSVRIGYKKFKLSKECPLHQWNLSKIQNLLRELKELKEFRIYFYPSNSDAELFTFKKLCERGVVVDCVPMTDCS